MSNFNSADIAAFKDVWVFCEQREGKLMPTDFELISKGRDLADELGVNLCGLLLGGEGIESAAKELGGYGADKVLVCESPLLAVYQHPMPMPTVICVRDRGSEARGVP